MCVQCKGLVGCSKNGCTQTPANRLSVAELLARALHADDKARFVPAGPLPKSRREVTAPAMALS